MKILYTLLISLITLTTNAQVAVEWAFSDTASVNYYPITHLISKGLITYVYSEDTSADTTSYIFRIDENGIATNSDTIQHYNFYSGSKSMVMDQDGNIYFCTDTKNQNLNSKIRIIKFDSLLNRVWDIVLHDTNNVDYGASGLLYSEIDNSICIIGSRTDSNSYQTTIKIDTDGLFKWESYSTSHPFFELGPFKIDHFGNIILGGISSSSGNGDDITLCKLDTSGTIVWYNTFDGSSHDDDGLIDLYITSQNNIVTLNRFEDTIPIRLRQFDPACVLQWEVPMPNVVHPVMTIDNSDAVYTGVKSTTPSMVYYLDKFNSSGSHLMSDSCDFQPSAGYTGSYSYEIQTDDSANVFLLAAVDSSSITQWAVAKFDSSLNQQFAIINPENIPDYYSEPSSLLLNDKGFIIAGTVNSELRVIQFTENFNVGIQSIFQNDDILISPNPSTDFIKYRMKNEFKGEIHVKIYDINNKCILQKNNYSNSATNNIDVQSLSPGLYFISFLMGDRQVMAKFIKL